MNAELYHEKFDVEFDVEDVEGSLRLFLGQLQTRTDACRDSVIKDGQNHQAFTYPWSLGKGPEGKLACEVWASPREAWDA